MSTLPPCPGASAAEPAASLNALPTLDASATRPTAVLICGVGTGNIGNDVSLDVAQALFTELVPNIDLVVATPFVDGARDVTDLPVMPVRQDLTLHRSLPSRAAVAWAVLTTELKRLGRLWCRVKKTDAVIVTGTGILDDFAEHPWNMPYALLSWSCLARLARRKFVFLAVGAGPIENPVSRAEFVVATRLASHVTYRDEGSRIFMAGIGADRSDARVCPDLAFGFLAPDATPPEPMSDPLTVGVGAMSYGGWSRLGEGPIYDTYVECLTGVVTALTADGHRVRFLVGQPCDLPVVHDIIARCPAEVSAGLEVPEIETFSQLLHAVAATDVVIATRYHNVVAALLMRRPVVSLSYAPKNVELLSPLGLSGFDCSVETASVQWVLDRVADYHTGRATLDEANSDLLTQWTAQVHEEIRRTAQLVGWLP